MKPFYFVTWKALRSKDHRLRRSPARLFSLLGRNTRNPWRRWSSHVKFAWRQSTERLQLNPRFLFFCTKSRFFPSKMPNRLWLKPSNPFAGRYRRHRPQARLKHRFLASPWYRRENSEIRDGVALHLLWCCCFSRFSGTFKHPVHSEGFVPK